MGLLSKPKAPKKTAEELALERSQKTMLNKERASTEDKLAALSRGKLGRASLLGNAARTQQEAAGGGRSSSGGGAGNLAGTTKNTRTGPRSLINRITPKL